MISINLPVARIRATSPRLYASLKPYLTGTNRDEIDWNKGVPFHLSESLREWSEQDQKRQDELAADAKARADKQAEHEAQIKDEVRAWAEKEVEKHSAQAKRDQQQALDRLKQFNTERGLEPSASNAALISDYIEKSLGGVWTESNVDAAVLALQAQLRWSLKGGGRGWVAGDRLPDDASPAQLAQSDITDVAAWKVRRQMLDSKAQADKNKK